LIGIGFALIFGVLNLVHFAHGEVYMIGAFLGFMLIRDFKAKTYRLDMILAFFF